MSNFAQPGSAGLYLINPSGGCCNQPSGRTLGPAPQRFTDPGSPLPPPRRGSWCARHGARRHRARQHKASNPGGNVSIVSNFGQPACVGPYLIGLPRGSPATEAGPRVFPRHSLPPRGPHFLLALNLGNLARRFLGPLILTSAPVGSVAPKRRVIWIGTPSLLHLCCRFSSLAL